VDLAPEWLAFLEDWLALRYRRGEEEGNPLRQLVLFLAVHLGGDEPVGVLLFPVELGWRTGREPWSVPSPVQRKRAEAPVLRLGSGGYGLKYGSFAMAMNALRELVVLS
jgi:hypothetical protein